MRWKMRVRMCCSTTCVRPCRQRNSGVRSIWWSDCLKKDLLPRTSRRRCCTSCKAEKTRRQFGHGVKNNQSVRHDIMGTNEGNAFPTVASSDLGLKIAQWNGVIVETAGTKIQKILKAERVNPGVPSLLHLLAACSE